MNKMIVIVGPTSSGKSELAVKLAKKFNGEIISCDSRQVYVGMNLGTGKIQGKWHSTLSHGREKVWNYVYKDVAHHLIDFISPKRQYSAALFQRDARKAIADVIKRGKLPILCGGTGHYLDTVVYNQQIPDVKPNLKLRKQLGKKSADSLFRQLKKLDSHRAAAIDRFNKRRLIRALEIALTTGKPISKLDPHPSPLTPTLWLGISLPQKALYKKIDLRLKQRLKAGMIDEVKNLHSKGLSWKRLESFGLEYKYISLYLQGKIKRDDMVTQLSYAIKHYSKRQLTWWKRNKEIKWIDDPKKAAKLLEKFLK